MFPTPPITDQGAAGLYRRVLVLAPLDGDARVVSHVLVQGGFDAFVCAGISGAAAEIVRNEYTGAGAAIVAQEALSSSEPEERQRLADVLTRQPAWSDLPLILLAGASWGEDGAWNIARGLDPVGNITILERPLRRTTLLNAVTVALRARARQHELRATLSELRQHREHLEETIVQKTSELAASMTSLRASERLASLGTLAAGLGHDIANLTLPIRARLDALRMSCTTSESQNDADAIDLALTHLSRLSAGMRLIGMDPERMNASAFATDLSSWASETVPMLRAALPRHVRIESQIPPGLSVNVARHRLAQAVFNLVQNAGEAMATQSEGEIRVTAELASEVGAPMVRLCVSDDGPGMAPEILSRCFEPYFSTKGRVIATGMGLGMVKGIIEAAQGTVMVKSALGRGTVFTLMLPAAQSVETRAGGTVPPRTCAVTVADARIVSLSRMIMKQMALKFLQHEGPQGPVAAMWLLANPDPIRVTQYLHQDPARRVVVLLDEDESASSHGWFTGASDRVIVLPSSPTPTALRRALSLAGAAIPAVGERA